MTDHDKSRNAGFTLIELMVAVAIIAVLVGILIPSLSAVTTNAKRVATTALFTGLDQGLESYRAEDALGGTYPPSQTDAPNAPTTIKDPLSGNPAELILAITGANLLVYGLVGADRLGTPGFSDLDGDGQWWNDQGADDSGSVDGAYFLNVDTLEPTSPRYPGGGGAYVGDTARESIRTYRQLFDDGVMVTFNAPFPSIEKQPLFTDAWGRPVLYYRANRAARYMVTNPGVTNGIYDSRDNTTITGSTAMGGFAGVDFGPGLIDDPYFHKIAVTQFPEIDPSVHNVATSSNFDNTFERFILDKSVTVRNTPVNRDSYLLISAGADAIYGTTDDITNWTRD